MNMNKNSRRKSAAVQDSSTNGSTFMLCSLIALLAVPNVAEESATRGFMDMDMRGRGGGGGGGSAAHLDGRELEAPDGRPYYWNAMTGEVQ